MAIQSADYRLRSKTEEGTMEAYLPLWSFDMTLKVDWAYDPHDPARSHTMGDWLSPTRRQWLVIAGLLLMTLAGAFLGIGR
jgi:hypothetical protein